MTTLFLELIALVSQGIYFGRGVYQTKASLNAGKSITPTFYWVLTIIAVSLIGVYGYFLGSIILPVTAVFNVGYAVINILIEKGLIGKKGIKHD